MMNKKIVYFILSCIFLFALVLRVFNLGGVPRSLHNDEVANTYVGRYIIENGVDLYGNSWPLLYFDKFGDYPPVLPMYLSGMGSKIFGNNEFGSRIGIAPFGALLVFPLFFISKLLFKDDKIALFSSFLSAILPWGIILSRVNAEGIVALLFFSVGILLLLLSSQKKSVRFLISSLFIFLFTYFLYPSYRMIVPLSLLPFCIISFKNCNKKYNTVLIFGIIVSIFLTLYISSTIWGKGRFDQVSIFNPVSGVQIKSQALIFNEDNVFIARIFNNKIVGYSREFLNQYLEYFSPAYLFSRESVNKVYAIPNNGLLYIFMLGLIFLAVIPYKHTVFKKINAPFFLYICYLLIISPISSALTINDSPNMHRSLPMLPFLILIASYGFYKLTTIKIKYFPVKLVFFLLVMLEVLFFSHNYLQHASIYRSSFSNDANKELVQYILKNKNTYKTIFMTGDGGWLPIYYLYYKNDFNKKYAGEFKSDFKINKLDNLKFRFKSCPSRFVNKKIINSKVFEKNVLIIDSEECDELKGIKRIKTIRRVDLTDAYYVSIPK